MTETIKGAIVICFAQAVPVQPQEGKMGVNYARLAFVHRLVTNFYEKGWRYHQTARTVLERFGGLNYLEELEKQVDEEDTLARNQLANLYFVWWRITGEEVARDRARTIWSKLIESDQIDPHAIQMLAYLALMDHSTPPEVVRLRISQLRSVRKQTTDVDRANRLAELARQLDEQFFRRCQK